MGERRLAVLSWGVAGNSSRKASIMDWSLDLTKMLPGLTSTSIEINVWILEEGGKGGKGARQKRTYVYHPRIISAV